jgi:hypothetical protein
MVSQTNYFSNQNYSEIIEELDKIYQLKDFLPMIEQEQHYKQSYT